MSTDESQWHLWTLFKLIMFMKRKFINIIDDDLVSLKKWKIPVGYKVLLDPVVYFLIFFNFIGFLYILKNEFYIYNIINSKI